jgi:hypothetical protein
MSPTSRTGARSINNPDVDQRSFFLGGSPRLQQGKLDFNPAKGGLIAASYTPHLCTPSKPSYELSQLRSVIPNEVAALFPRVPFPERKSPAREAFAVSKCAPPVVEGSLRLRAVRLSLCLVQGVFELSEQMS